MDKDKKKDTEKLVNIIINSLEDIKGKDIKIINTAKLTSLFFKIIVVTGDSKRQVKSLCLHTSKTLKNNGYEVISCEGLENGEWVLLDAGDVVVHSMLPNIREYYQLESLWQE